MKLEDSKKVHELYVHYWLAMANTGACKNKKMFRGDKKLTDEELVEEALDCALRHIHILADIADKECRDNQPDFSIDPPEVEYMNLPS